MVTRESARYRVTENEGGKAESKKQKAVSWEQA